MSGLHTCSEIESILQAGFDQESVYQERGLVPIGLIETHSPNRLYVSSLNESVWLDDIGSNQQVLAFSSVEELITNLRAVPNRYQTSKVNFSRLRKRWGEEFWQEDQVVG